jgi:hypothetical protein
MDTRIKILIGTVIGAGLGWLVGNLIVNQILAAESEFDDWDYLDEEDLDWVKEIDEEIETEESEERIMKNKGKRVVRPRNYSDFFGSNRPELAALAAKYNNEEVTPEEETLAPDEAAFENYEEIEEEKKDPSIISSTEYLNGDMGYEKVVLYYYAGDDVVTDEDNNPVNRPEQLLGDDALVSFGELSDNPKMVYVRNNGKKADYHVIRLDTTYSLVEVEPTRRNHSTRKVREENASEDDD